MMKNSILILSLFIFIGKVQAQKDEVQNPIQNFEKLWSEFDSRYANFELKKVNWDSIYEQYRPLVTTKTTNKELFEISCSMLQELNDGHVTIEANFEEEEMECGPPYTFHLDEEFANEEDTKQFVSRIDTTFIEHGFSKAIRHQITEETNFQYRLSDSFGYLRLDEMTEKITFGKFKRILDLTVKDFQTKKGIIIDLRFNGGGWDYISYVLASRFIPKGVELGHFKKTKIKGKNAFKKMKYKKVNSGGKYQFTKSIVILTSDDTASASEVFLLLMKDLPNVHIVGDTTEGIFSTMYEFNLPNKWFVSLSHQQFLSKDNINYEGKGIEPDIQILNRKTDERDVVLERALQYLNILK